MPGRARRSRSHSASQCGHVELARAPDADRCCSRGWSYVASSYCCWRARAVQRNRRRRIGRCVGSSVTSHVTALRDVRFQPTTRAVASGEHDEADAFRRAVKLPAIEYPEGALEEGLGGTVFVDVEVNAAGDVTTGAVASGPEGLRLAAFKMAMGLKFEPKNETTPVRVAVIYQIRSDFAAVSLSGATRRAGTWFGEGFPGIETPPLCCGSSARPCAMRRHRKKCRTSLPNILPKPWSEGSRRCHS